jgi:DNA invertase Pin-like site-specific DNA recombinase
MGRNQIRERTRMALHHKRERGDGLGGTPLGFHAPAAGAALVPIETELATVRTILALRTRDARRWTFRPIAERLRREGHQNKHGGQWNPATIKKVWDRRELYRSHFG